MSVSEKLYFEMAEMLSKENPKIRHLAERQYDAIIGEIAKKADADPTFAQCVMQDHKTLKNCISHIMAKAKPFASQNVAMIDDQTVFSWAFDYFKLNDAEQQKKEEENKTNITVKKQNKTTSDSKKEKSEATAKKQKPAQEIKLKKGIEGQVSLFDLFEG